MFLIVDLSTFLVYKEEPLPKYRDQCDAFNRTWSEGDYRCNFNVVVVSLSCWHSDTQVSIELKRGSRESKKILTLGTAKSPLYIEVDVASAVA